MNALIDVLAPGRMPVRDESGWAYHPELDNLVADGEEGDELPLDLEKIDAAGFEAVFVGMAYDIEDDHPAYVAYFEDGAGSCAGWEPSSPGPDWRLVAVYDTEDGPAAMFVRPLDAGGQPA